MQVDTNVFEGLPIRTVSSAQSPPKTTFFRRFCELYIVWSKSEHSAGRLPYFYGELYTDMTSAFCITLYIRACSCR